jgi:GntR family carbon starvation induced transcriptional regulator
MTDTGRAKPSEVGTSEAERSSVVFWPIRKSGLTETVYRRLRAEIIAAYLLPGELLTLDELGTRYGVSRTPVREALRRLEAEGLVLFREHRRVQVAPLTLGEIAGNYAVRILTEGFAVARSIRHAGAEIASDAEAIYRLMESDARAGESDSFYQRHLDFHRAIYAGAGSPELARVTEDLRTRTDRHRHVHASFRPGNLRATVDGHAPILKAVRDADPEAAARLVVEHLYGTAVELVTQAGGTGSTLLDEARSAALDGLAGTLFGEQGR